MPATFTPVFAPSTHASRVLHLTGAALLLASLLFVGTPAFAQNHDGHGTHGAQASSTAASTNQSQSVLADGEVKKIDKANGKVTVSHGPLKNLGMPPMTMVFKVKEAAWLDSLKAGMKIRFQAETIDGALTIVRYEAAH